jgi:hypothetical protein
VRRRDMVNIQSVVYIDNNGTYAYNSFDEWFAQTLRVASDNCKRKLLGQKQIDNIFSDTVASQYGYDKEQTKHVIFLFGNTVEADKRLQDISIRELIFKLENRIILEIVDTHRVNYIVVTIHRNEEFEILTTRLRQSSVRLETEL